MNFWTIERIKELLGDPDGWPKMRVEDEEADAWLDGYQARYTVVNEPGFAYAWVPGERMARIFAAAPEALAWCVETIVTAYALANSYAATNEAQRKRIDELLATVAKTNQRAEAAEAKLAAVPVGSIRLVVWALDDGPYDEIAIDSVNRWLDEWELEQLKKVQP